MFKRHYKERPKNEEGLLAPCHDTCSSMYNGVCIRLPRITLHANRFYYLKDPKNPDGGEYIERNGQPIDSKFTINIPSLIYCPFAKPKKRKREKDKKNDSRPINQSSSLDSEVSNEDEGLI